LTKNCLKLGHRLERNPRRPRNAGPGSFQNTSLDRKNLMGVIDVRQSGCVVNAAEMEAE
jgi:hypothetical protein